MLADGHATGGCAPRALGLPWSGGLVMRLLQQVRQRNRGLHWTLTSSLSVRTSAAAVTNAFLLSSLSCRTSAMEDTLPACA